MSGLHPNYNFAQTIHDREVPPLLQTVEIGEDVSDEYFALCREGLTNAGYNFIDVGVRCQDSELVGYGNVIYKDDEGELGDFVVNPKHQGRGIGRAIIDERLRRATVAGVNVLTIPYLEHTNTLASYYLERGFEMTGGGILVHRAMADTSVNR